MRKFLAAALAIAVLLSISVSRVECQQEMYWIGLNFEVRIKEDGTALVIVREHPFALNGTSLFGDEEVLNQLLEEAQVNQLYAALMFASSPEYVYAEIVDGPKVSMEDGVLADPLNKGEMIEYEGAVVTTVMVNLSTAEYVRELGQGEYEIRIVDPFTARDPRSWIDVMRISWDPNVEVIDASWKPARASGPSEQGEDFLLWMNYNEPSAPDVYILRVRLPGFAAGVAPEAHLSVRASRVDDAVRVVLSSDEGGYAVVRIVGPGEDQSRGVALEPGAQTTLEFWSDANPLKVEVYVGGKLVAEAPVSGGAITTYQRGELPKGGPLPAGLLIVGILILLVSLAVGRGSELEEQGGVELWELP